MTPRARGGGATTVALRRQAEVHGKIAHLYSLERVNATTFNRAFNDYFNRLVLSMFPADREARILDMMGGTGILSHALMGAGYRDVTLLDLSLDMLCFAQESLRPAPRLCAGDAMRLPFEDGMFDVVVCRGGLHHLPDLDASVGEAWRVLRKKGTFLAFDPCDDMTVVRWLRRAMYRMFSFFDAEHERGLTSREVRTSLERAGFVVTEMRKFGLLGYIVSGIEGHLFPRLFSLLPRSKAAGEWVCRIDARLEGAPFLLAMAFKATKE